MVSIMKIGHFNISTSWHGSHFTATCFFNSVYICTGEKCTTRREALDLMLNMLEEALKKISSDIKPKYQIKSKQVDAVQWNGEDIDGIHQFEEEVYTYRSNYIFPGDWIVDGVLVPKKEFEKDYEAVQ